MDHTNYYTEEEIKTGKTLSALSYLGILWIFSFFFGGRRNPYARFHLNQGAVILGSWLALSVVARVVKIAFEPIGMSLIITIVNLVISLVQVCLLVLIVIGLMNVISGRARELPLIGSIRIFK